MARYIWIAHSRKNRGSRKTGKFFSVVEIEELVKVQHTETAKPLMTVRTKCFSQNVQNYIFELKLLELLKIKVMLIKPL